MSEVTGGRSLQGCWTRGAKCPKGKLVNFSYGVSTRPNPARHSNCAQESGRISMISSPLTSRSSLLSGNFTLLILPPSCSPHLLPPPGALLMIKKHNNNGDNNNGNNNKNNTRSVGHFRGAKEVTHGSDPRWVTSAPAAEKAHVLHNDKQKEK